MTLRVETRRKYLVKVITKRGNVVTFTVVSHTPFQARKRILNNQDVERVISTIPKTPT